MEAQIMRIFLFLEGSASAVIKCSDETEISIEIPRAALEGKTMDQRYKAINDRVERYISCMAKEVVTGPFNEVVPAEDVVTYRLYDDVQKKYIHNKVSGVVFEFDNVSDAEKERELHGFDYHERPVTSTILIHIFVNGSFAF